MISEAYAAGLAVVEPSTPFWPYLLLFALVAIGIGAIVLRVKRPELFSRVAKEAAREKAQAESLVSLWRGETGWTQGTVRPLPPAPAGQTPLQIIDNSKPISNDGILR